MTQSTGESSSSAAARAPVQQSAESSPVILPGLEPTLDNEISNNSTGDVAGATAGAGAGAGAGIPAEAASPAAITRTLAETMRAPSTRVPAVVVLGEDTDFDLHRPVRLDAREDLWLTTADGRYNSLIIPLEVGSPPETFYVHRNILLKAKYFRVALDGDFHESQTQSMNFPEEDPAIFHFLVTFLYEKRYVPIQPLAGALQLNDDVKGKGKGKAMRVDNSRGGENGETGSDASTADNMNRADVRQRHHSRQQRHLGRYFEQARQLRPGKHHAGCRCPLCQQTTTFMCGNCGALAGQPYGHPHMPQHMPQHMLPPGAYINANQHRRNRNIRDGQRRGIPGPRGPGPGVPPGPPGPPGGRGPLGHGYAVPNGGSGGNDDQNRSEEDARSWLMAYELNLDVYLCASRFMMEEFKREVAQATVDMMESAGTDAALPKVLHLCVKLLDGLDERDPLLRMIFARVGFLQSVMWQRVPMETSEFLTGNPQVAALILREMAGRREEDGMETLLPSMEAADSPFNQPQPWTQAEFEMMLGN